MLKSKKILGKMNDLPLIIGFVAIASIYVYYFYNYQQNKCIEDSSCVAQMREKGK